MDVASAGIHHVTAIAADAQRNVDFYTDVLGLRLVKRSVNQDDPTTYHLYYGDDVGTPGTILTFFPWQGIRGGRIGTGQVAATAFTIPESSLGWWLARLVGTGLAFKGPERRFDEQLVRFHDPDGLMLELVARAGVDHAGWGGGTVPGAHAIRGFDGVTIWAEQTAPTASVLTGVLGFRQTAGDGSLTRFESLGTAPIGRIVDVRQAADFPRGLQGGGTVHHVAFRAGDQAAEDTMRERVIAAGLMPTEVIERFYFRSVYFREPGHVLFELATDAPGFTVDEPRAELGRGIKLPPWLEPQRVGIERALPPLRLPAATLGAAAGSP